MTFSPYSFRFPRLLLLFAFAVWPAFAAGPVHYYPYDDCEPTALAFSFTPKGYEARKASERALSDFVAGSYHGVMDFTGGYTLYLFPDHRAMFASFCDICPEPELVGEGRWKLEKDSLLIDWDWWPKKSEFVSKYYGACKELHLFLFFDQQKKVQNVRLVSKEKEEKTVSSHFVQRSPYKDWKEIADSLRKPKK